MTKTVEMPNAPRKPDGVLTTQKRNLTLITEVFFNHDSRDTFQDKLLSYENQKKGKCVTGGRGHLAYWNSP